MTELQMKQLVDRLAQTIRVHCKAYLTRVDVSEDWIMGLARNQVAAAEDLVDQFAQEALTDREDFREKAAGLLGW